MIKLNHQKLFHLKGLAVKNFLQGQLCSDIHLLEEGHSCLTGICNAKGRLVASPYLLLKNGDYYLALDQSMAEILFLYWKPYLMVSRVQPIVCEHYQAYGLFSPSTLSYDFKIQCKGRTQASIIFTQDHLDSTDTRDTITWFNAMVESGVVIISPETSKELMPLTLGYDGFGALSFNKGCYVGQEILARIHYKGSVNQSVEKIFFDEPTIIGGYEAIRDEHSNLVGHIALSPHGNIPVQSTLAVLHKNAKQAILKLDHGGHCKLT